MLVEKTHLQIEDGLAYDAEPEMSRLNDSRVDWADWNLIDTFTLDLFENVSALGFGRIYFYFSVFERFEKRMKIRGISLVKEKPSFVESTFEFYSKAVGDFPFIPASGGKGFGDGNCLVAA